MKSIKFSLLFSFLFSLIFFQVKAQKLRQIEIIQAGSLEGSKENSVELRRLVGDVIFKQDDTFLYCDSALFYEVQNTIDAYGVVRVESPRAKIYGDFLHYEGNSKIANMTGKVVKLTDEKMVLTTTALNYNMETDIGEYIVGGKMVDKENVLTSKKGYYFAKEKCIYFKDNVVLVNPKYTMKSDTLKYNTVSETVSFFGPTTITTTGKDTSYIYCEYGWYNTKTEKSYFSKNAYLQSKENRLSGDSLLYDRVTGIGKAWNDVKISDSINKVIISGEYAMLNEKKGISYVTDYALLTKVFTTDSMFLHADTLYGKQDTITKLKTYFAYNNVRIFKTDLQGVCDSLIYSTADSSIYFYSKPIIWSSKNQLTADTIQLQLANDKMSRMYLYSNSFIAGMEDSLRYNQVKGRAMVGYFEDNQLKTIRVTGNGQTIYYIRNKKKQLTGVNRADCSDMLIKVDSSTVKKISLLNKPDATLYPIKELLPSELLLKGFKWYGELQPKRKEDVYISVD